MSQPWLQGFTFFSNDNLGYYCLFISPNELVENNVINDNGLPVHVDEVGVCDLCWTSHDCDVTDSHSQVLRIKDQIISAELSWSDTDSPKHNKRKYVKIMHVDNYYVDTGNNIYVMLLQFMYVVLMMLNSEQRNQYLSLTFGQAVSYDDNPKSIIAWPPKCLVKTMSSYIIWISLNIFPKNLHFRPAKEIIQLCPTTNSTWPWDIQQNTNNSEKKIVTPMKSGRLFELWWKNNTKQNKKKTLMIVLLFIASYDWRSDRCLRNGTHRSCCWRHERCYSGGTPGIPSCDISGQCSATSYSHLAD